MKIILLNGPPSSGKDTGCFAAFQHIKSQGGLPYVLRMSHPIKEAFGGMTGERIDQFGNNMSREGRKEEIISWLGCSYRQWQIDFSERFMKPLYGDNVFARIWLHRAAQLAPDTVMIVPDCGFKIELQTLIHAAQSPKYKNFTLDDLFLIRLYRKGFDFSRDSREHVKPPADGLIREADLINEDRDVFEATIIRQVTSFLKGKP
jgi:hypothetical protein